MANKDRQKKLKKLAKEKLKARKWAERNKYPRIELIEDGESPDFMAAVTDIVNSFDFDNHSHCSPESQLMYRTYRTIGLDGLNRWIASPETQDKYMKPDQSFMEFRASMLVPLYSHLGEWIFSRLPDKYRKDPLPFFYFCVTPVDKALRITFKFVPHMPSEHGTIYHSPYEPTVAKYGVLFKVGFLRHAVERACQRLAAVQPISYCHFQPLALFFRHCVYFESLTLPDGQEAIRLLGRCEGDFGNTYIHNIASMKVGRAGPGSYYFLLGYCPVAIVRRSAVAMTFLYPGYRNTPEAALVESAPISKAMRHSLRAAAQHNTLAELVKGKGVDVFKWYHENGLPQVVWREEDIYRFD